MQEPALRIGMLQQIVGVEFFKTGEPLRLAHSHFVYREYKCRETIPVVARTSEATKKDNDSEFFRLLMTNQTAYLAYERPPLES